MTLLLAILAAYFLDPLVGGLECIRIPRVIGSLLVLLTAIALLVCVGYWSPSTPALLRKIGRDYSQVLRRSTATSEQPCLRGKAGRGVGPGDRRKPPPRYVARKAVAA